MTLFEATLLVLTVVGCTGVGLLAAVSMRGKPCNRPCVPAIPEQKPLVVAIESIEHTMARLTDANERLVNRCLAMSEWHQRLMETERTHTREFPGGHGVRVMDAFDRDNEPLEEWGLADGEPTTARDIG